VLDQLEASLSGSTWPVPAGQAGRVILGRAIWVMNGGLVTVGNRVVMSPHFDDAVLSCWCAITGGGEGVQVTVVTVFGGTPPAGVAVGDWDRAAGAADPQTGWRTRCAEDEAVLTAAGARVVHLPFVDAQYRTEGVPRAAVAAALADLVREADEVWIPAGIGGHADHLLVAEIGQLVSGGRRRCLYADLPYAAAAPGWPVLLAAARRGRLDDESLRAQLDASPMLPGLAVPVLSQLSPAKQADKLAAVLSYRSQVAPLVGAFGRWFEDPLTAPFELAWDAGPGPRPGRPVDALTGRPIAVPLREPAAAGPGTPPFLTVLVRTLGNRPEELAATLQSLAGQNCTDFEVLLLHHTQHPDATRDVGWHPGPALAADLVHRIRIVTVVGGARGRPLNTGIVAILDDDDVAFPDWVATFRDLAARHPGAVLRSRVRSDTRQDDGSWRHENAYGPESFDPIDHLQVNSSPICGLAFPRDCFTDFALRFDESLPVVEDWDLLLQAAALCGVAESPAITAAYRRWNRADDSLAVHSHTVWEAAMRTVVAIADQRPLLLPPGSVSRLRRDQDTLTQLRGQASEAEQDHRQHLTAHRQELDRLTAQAAHERGTLLAAHQQELAGLRERHAAEVAAAIDRTTLMFHQSTSWKLTVPVRALGPLRLRLARKRLPQPSPDPPPNSPAPTPWLDDQRPPAPGVALQPPPDPTVRTWPATQFEQLYRQHPDPWGYTSRWYEQRKYAITVACLPRRRYRRAFEPGCSIGVLTELLAARTDSLISADFATTAVEHAKHRLVGYPHVDIRQLSVPTQWPEGSFDLILISEIATYLSDQDLTILVQKTTGCLESGGTLMLVHFRPDAGTPRTADQVHDRFRRHPHLAQQTTHQEPEFILDVFLRLPPT
jgi:hypothetical protein